MSANDDKARAWKKFIDCGEIEADCVSSAVSQSWQYCMEHKIDYREGKGCIDIDPTVLQALLEQNEAIIRIAKPFMQNLYQFFRNSGFIVVLADTKGYILENFGDDTCLKNAHYLNFVPGANWSELQVGTNAIGLILSGKIPVQVTGCEHYCMEHHRWTCAAAPIFDDQGKMIAVLDISGPCCAAYPHTLGMVVAAAEAIAMQLKIQRQHREALLAHKRMNGVFHAMSEGIIIVDKEGVIVTTNNTTQKLFKTSATVMGQSVEAAYSMLAPLTRNVLNKQVGCFEQKMLIPSKNGVKHCLVSGEAIMDENGIHGAIIIIKPLQQTVQTGYQASFQFSDIIGRSPAISETIRLAKLAAASTSSILLQGESGTGKEMFAQAIHRHSSRGSGPFVAVNCGAIPRELIGSELFGYAEGAFTGAKRGGQPGKFELAAGGTLFLDEIGDMPVEQQVTLLRVLQEKKLSRIGSENIVAIDVRIICATNKDLLQAVEQGTFRRDLYYRLNVISLAIPPLRERGEDSVLLFRHFVELAGQESSRSYTVDTAVLDCLRNYSWPGNVRELYNVVERAVHLNDDGSITLLQLPAEILRPDIRIQALSISPLTGRSLFKEKKRRQIAQQECAEVLALLAQYGGNISQVAKHMGIARTTLYRKMRLYSLGDQSKV